jgi:hypothetical protein
MLHQFGIKSNYYFPFSIFSSKSYAMSLMRKFLYLVVIFLLPFFSCKKVKELISDALSPEVKISQEFEFIFKEYAKQEAHKYGFDTTNLNIDNLPPSLYSVLQGLVQLDTVGIDSFVIDRLAYVYNYALADLDQNLSENPANVLKFGRKDIFSAKVDSARLYLLPTSPINQQDFKNIKIDASNKNIQQPLTIVNTNTGFKYEPVQERGYANMMRLPVINPNEEYRQYLVPPNDSVRYTFNVEFNKPIKFALDDRYKLAFNYKIVFKK